MAKRERSTKLDLYVGGSIILLAILLVLPEVIGSELRRSFLFMPEQFQTKSALFQVSASITLAGQSQLTAEFKVENTTERVIRKAWATARLDDAFAPLLFMPGQLNFHVPWATGSWWQLLHSLPPRYDLAPVSWSGQERQQGEIPGFVITWTTGISAEGCSEAELRALLALPFKVKIWHADGVEYLLVNPTVRIAADSNSSLHPE